MLVVAIAWAGNAGTCVIRRYARRARSGPPEDRAWSFDVMLRAMANDVAFCEDRMNSRFVEHRLGSGC